MSSITTNISYSGGSSDFGALSDENRDKISVTSSSERVPGKISQLKRGRERDCKKLMKMALENEAAFERSIRWTGGSRIEPKTLENLMFKLADEKPALFDRIFPSLELSTSARRQLWEYRPQPILFKQTLGDLSRKDLVYACMNAFHPEEVWKTDSDQIDAFYKFSDLNKEKEQTLDTWSDLGCCLGEAIQYLGSGQNSIPHALFIQKAGCINPVLNLNRKYYIELAKKVFENPQKFKLVLNRLQRISGLNLHEMIKQSYSLDDNLCFLVGRMATKFYLSKEIMQRIPVESYLFNHLRRDKSGLNSESWTPAYILKREGLRLVNKLEDNILLYEFPLRTKNLRRGLYILRIQEREKGSLFHAVPISFENLTFFDSVDRDPETLKPIVYQFSSPEELLNFVNAYLAIYYKNFQRFTLLEYERISKPNFAQTQ